MFRTLLSVTLTICLVLLATAAFACDFGAASTYGTSSLALPFTPSLTYQVPTTAFVPALTSSYSATTVAQAPVVVQQAPVVQSFAAAPIAPAFSTGYGVGGVGFAPAFAFGTRQRFFGGARVFTPGVSAVTPGANVFVGRGFGFGRGFGGFRSRGVGVAVGVPVAPVVGGGVVNNVNVFRRRAIFRR